MSTSVVEANKNHENLFQPEVVLEWLTYAGNDERKLATLLALTTAVEPLSKTNIQRRLEAISGGLPLPDDSSSLFQFCEDSLEKVGAVDAAPAQALALGKYPKTVAGFEATSAAKEFGVPFAGALLNWSAQYIDTTKISLNILGQTGGKYAARAPLVRYWALYDLLTSSDQSQSQSPSIGYLAEHLPVQYNTRSTTVEHLERLGLVEVEGMHRENTRKFQILNPEYTEGPRKKPFRDLIPETQMLYQTFRIAHQVKADWEQDEFLNLMVALNPQADEAMIKKAKTYLAQALAPSANNMKGAVKDISGKQYKGYSKVTLQPDVAQAVHELVDIIDGFCSGDESIIASGRAAAERIIESPTEFSALYARGYERSTLTGKDESIAQHLLQLVGVSGGVLTVQETRKLYAQETGRNISAGNVRYWLGKLVAEGHLTVETGAHSKIKQRQEGHYRVADS